MIRQYFDLNTRTVTEVHLHRNTIIVLGEHAEDPKTCRSELMSDSVVHTVRSPYLLYPLCDLVQYNIISELRV